MDEDKKQLLLNINGESEIIVTRKRSRKAIWALMITVVLLAAIAVGGVFILYEMVLDWSNSEVSFVTATVNGKMEKVTVNVEKKWVQYHYLGDAITKQPEVLTVHDFDANLHVIKVIDVENSNQSKCFVGTLDRQAFPSPADIMQFASDDSIVKYPEQMELHYEGYNWQYVEPSLLGPVFHGLCHGVETAYIFSVYNDYDTDLYTEVPTGQSTLLASSINEDGSPILYSFSYVIDHHQEEAKQEVRLKREQPSTFSTGPQTSDDRRVSFSIRICGTYCPGERRGTDQQTANSISSSQSDYEFDYQEDYEEMSSPQSPAEPSSNQPSTQTNSGKVETTRGTVTRYGGVREEFLQRRKQNMVRISRRSADADNSEVTYRRIGPIVNTMRQSPTKRPRTPRTGRSADASTGRIILSNRLPSIANTMRKSLPQQPRVPRTRRSARPDYGDYGDYCDYCEVEDPIEGEELHAVTLPPQPLVRLPAQPQNPNNDGLESRSRVGILTKFLSQNPTQRPRAPRTRRSADADNAGSVVTSQTRSRIGPIVNTVRQSQTQRSKAPRTRRLADADNARSRVKIQSRIGPIVNTVRQSQTQRPRVPRTRRSARPDYGDYYDPEDPIEGEELHAATLPPQPPVQPQIPDNDDGLGTKSRLNIGRYFKSRARRELNNKSRPSRLKRSAVSEYEYGSPDIGMSQSSANQAGTQGDIGEKSKPGMLADILRRLRGRRSVVR